MKESELRSRVKAFAIHVVSVCDNVDSRKGRGVLFSEVSPMAK